MLPFDRGAVEKSLRTTLLGRRLEHHHSIDSTNSRALELGGPPGLTIVADAQTAGRGRRGRRWFAPPGRALLMSVVVAPVAAPRAPLVTFAAGIATCEVVRGLGPEAHLKWPNDVLVGRRKIAGILCESRAAGPLLGPTVVGIGVNVNQLGGDELPAGATSCRVETGTEYRVELLLAELLNRLESEMLALARGDLASVVERWEALSQLHRGCPVEVDREDGLLLGTTDGIESDGALRVRRGGEVHRVVGGGVTFL